MQGLRGEYLSPRRITTGVAALMAAGALLVACGGHAVGSTSGTPAVRAAVSVSAAALPGGDWLRFGYDAQRSGVGPANTGISAADLGALQTRVVQLGGTVDSSPVELHDIEIGGRPRDVVILTTTYGRTLALDASTGARLWEYVPSDIGTYQGGSQITTATPIIDADRGFVYTASPDGRIHKLAVASGREVHSGHWPVRVTFDPRREKIAGALNLSGSSVIVVTGGYYGDAPTYEGHVVMINRTSGRISAVWNADCSDRHHLLVPSSCRADTSFGGSAIWARAGAVVEPGSGKLLVATGNGPFNGSIDWGDSVLELSPGAGSLLHHWTPVDQAQLNAHDTDLGSTAPALLPAAHGYRLAVQGGKDGRLHLLNLNRLNATAGGAGGRLGGELEDIGSPGGAEVLTAPAVWSHRGRSYVFVADDGGTGAYVLSLAGRPHLKSAWQNTSAGTSPILAGGLLYVYDQLDASLTIYSPLSGRILRTLSAAHGHWSSPIVVGGRIILPTGGSTADNSPTSRLFIYHLPGR